MIDDIDFTAISGSWAYWPYIRYADEAGGAIDAPRWVPAGYMSARCGEHVGVALLRAGE